MRIISYHNHAKIHSGFVVGEQVYEISAVLRAMGVLAGPGTAPTPAPLDAWLRQGEAAWQELSRAYRDLPGAGEAVLQAARVGEMRNLELAPVVNAPGKILCAGLNYPAVDGSASKPAYPVLFLKPKSSLTGHRRPILLPPGEHIVEYEGEIAVVIGRKGKYIPEGQALAHVAGYCLANDLGAQDIQQRSSQWASGKLGDSFTPLGPYLVTPEEIDDPDDFHISTRLNQTRVQSASSAEMYYTTSELIAYISTLCTLEIGDLILTGSPKRVGGLPDPRTPLQAGDEVEITVPGLGTLCNPVIQEEYPQ